MYILSPLSVVLGWLADGILGGLLGSIFLGIWGPPASFLDATSIVINGNYRIESKFTGFLGGCCTYNVYENKLLLFDFKLAEFRAEYSPSSISGFNVNGDKAVIYYKNETLDSTIVQLK